MEELLIKVKNGKESSFIKDLLKKLKIQFETVSENDAPSGEEVKQSVINGQLAYKSGKADQFSEIEPKDLWNKLPSYFLQRCTERYFLLEKVRQ